MIVVDTSALIALTFEELEAERIVRLLSTSSSVISVANLLEAHMVLRRRRPDLVRTIDRFVAAYRIRPAPVEEGQLAVARAAFDRFGKGMGHPAQLTFGDCFAYALAKSLNAPLVFKGDDFARTDVTAAIY